MRNLRQSSCIIIADATIIDNIAQGSLQNTFTVGVLKKVKQNKKKQEVEGKNKGEKGEREKSREEDYLNAILKL